MMSTIETKLSQLSGAPRKGLFRRRGIFSKFVVSFVGLVVLVLIVNGVLETWFMYRETTQILAKAQSEKATTTANRPPRKASTRKLMLGAVVAVLAGFLRRRRVLEGWDDRERRRQVCGIESPGHQFDRQHGRGMGKVAASWVLASQGGRG